MATITFPRIRISLSPTLCTELAACEEGAYEDAYYAERHPNAGRVERPTVSHASKVAARTADKGYILITCPAEAEDMYYAVCSGVFKAKTPATYAAACRIADKLRPYAKPETVAHWPKPDREPFTGM